MNTQKLIKKIMQLGLSAILLAGSQAYSGIIYFSESEATSQAGIKQNVNLEKIIKKINEKYPGKKLEYFSRGFLQFDGEEFIQDLEIDEMIQEAGSNKEKTNKSLRAVDGTNFYSDLCFMIDSSAHHLGDETKDWLPIKEAEGLSYERKFTLKNVKDMKNPRLGVEVIFSHADNKVYINGNLVGMLPKRPRDEWGNRGMKLGKKLPFMYGEINISEYLKEGENTVRIESAKPAGWFKTYNDFIVKRIQIVYEQEKTPEKQPEKK